MRLRVRNVLLAAACCLFATTVLSQDTQYPAQNGMIPGPARPADFPAWLADLQHWREESRIRLGYDGSEYSRPDLKWTQTSFIQPQMMIHDQIGRAHV